MNKVIIFGIDHHNTLGLVRVFGINGIKPFGIITVKKGHEKEVYATKSKYWEKYWIVSDEHQGLKKILEMFSGESEKPVILPSSDGAELIIDENLESLKNYFIVPGIRETQGMVANLMSKTNQVRWANEIGLKVAKSWELDLCSDGCWKQIETYPCILKPVVSSEGHKVDITKCKSEQEAKKSIKILKDKGYKRILAQEFIYKEYEMELFGCITKKSKITPYLLSKHVREWPPTAGTVSCHDFIVDKKHKIIAEDILHKIMDYGYVGNIDIELFMVAGEIYLNEVNFRNSGDIFACFRNKVYYPLIWYLDVIGEDISKYNVAYDNNKYAMNETTDFRHVVYGKLKFKDWLKYYKNCGDFAIKFKGDNGPTMARYSRIILDVLKKGRLQKELGQRN